jgi:hypothetical protein
MTYDETIGKYHARAAGAVGFDILDPEGEVVASAADGWQAAAIVDLLNDETSPCHGVAEPA